MNHFRNIIVGAGPAGIAAASRLLENGVKDLLILEAESRLGGRICTCDIEGDVVELGAEWIHGEKNNVVYEMASKFNLCNSENPETIFLETNFYESGNRQVDKEVSRLMCCIYEKIMQVDHEDEPHGSLGDYFVKEYKKEIDILRRNVDVSDALVHMFQEVFEKWENSIDASHSWFDTSFSGHLEYWECEGNKLTTWKNGGYKTLFDLLENRFTADARYIPVREKIIFNKEVTHITWNKNSVNKTPNVTIKCNDGTKFTADYAILTLPLGVLKDKARDMFTPSLSERKLSSINGLGFGTVDKILLKFSHSWWTDDAEGFSFLWSEEDKRNDSSGWLRDVIAFHPLHPGSTILRGWIVGETARRMETLTDEEVLNGCLYLLNKFLGFKYDIPRAESVLRSRWYCNPHFRGSYSCRILESDKRNVWASDLAQPECNVNGKPVLLFAGEATHNHYFSTVHGAVESGWREADRLLKSTLNFDCPKRFYEVVIVGAGISGLAAARTLCEEGITDIIILEAQDQPGGRIRSVKVGDEWLELGAQWIHGDRNEVFNICMGRDLVTDQYSCEGQGLYLRENGSVIDDGIVREVDDLIKDILENSEEYVSCENDVIPRSIGDELINMFNKYLSDSNDSDDVKNMKMDLLSWHVRFHLIDNSCDDLSLLSAKAWGLYRFCGGNDYINFKRGYKSLIDALVQDLVNCTLLYSTPVCSITWHEDLDLEVPTDDPLNIASDNEKQAHRKSCANVICGNNISFDTNYVIITSSLGYLKSKYEKMFNPPLPSYLTKAIDSLGFGILGKIFLIYEKSWWDAGTKGFQLIWSHRKFFEEKRHWSYDITGFDVIIEGKPILLGWIGGDGARIVESMPENVIGLESTEILRRFTRNPKIPEPSRVIKSEWFTNEYVRGGYSHITVKYDVDGIDGSHLSQPVYTNVTNNGSQHKKPTILLAGEAVHKTHYSTVHGAYESGVGQARVVAKDIKIGAFAHGLK